jgi:hypothetical protein
MTLAFHWLARPDGTLSAINARTITPTTIAARDEIVRGWIVALAILTGLPR